MSFTCDELSTPIYSADLVNEASQAFGNLNTLTLTLYDQRTGAVINARNGQNVLNLNQVTLDAFTGALVWTMLAADNPIINDALRQEEHIALFIGTWTNVVAKRFNHRVSIIVRNISKIP